MALRKELTDLGVDAGAHTIHYHLQRRHRRRGGRCRRWRRSGGCCPVGASSPRSRTSGPRNSWRRFQAELPNECWQADTTHWALADGTDVEILNVIDDHSRLLVASRAFGTAKAADVVETFHLGASELGLPASMLTDNGMVFTSRRPPGAGHRDRAAPLGHHPEELETEPSHHLRQDRTLPTDDESLATPAQPDQPATIAQLQALLDNFVAIYNTRRPHRSLPQRSTPAVAYTARPKATPADRTSDTHWRVRHGRVDKTGRVTLRVAGRLHHIGLGYEHARTHVVMLITDLHVRVINATTGELLRDLTLDPDRDYYQPLGRPPDPNPKTATARTQIEVRTVSNVLRHHMEPTTGFEPATLTLAKKGQLTCSGNQAEPNDCLVRARSLRPSDTVGHLSVPVRVARKWHGGTVDGGWSSSKTSMGSCGSDRCLFGARTSPRTWRGTARRSP